MIAPLRDRGLRRRWTGAIGQPRLSPFVPNPCDGESAWLRLMNADIDQLTPGEAWAELQRLKSAIADLWASRCRPRIIWCGPDGARVVDQEWIVIRIRLLHDHLKAQQAVPKTRQLHPPGVRQIASGRL